MSRLPGHRPLPTGRPLRIVIGPKEISGQTPDYAAGFRALGHHVTTVIRERNPMFMDLHYDVEIGTQDQDAVARQLIDTHDVFVFQYGESLLPGWRDLPWLRNAGKAIIAICNGDDIRHSSAYHQQFGIPPQVHGDFYVRDAVQRPMQTLRVMERYASLMVSVPNQSGLALRPYMHFAYPIDLSLYDAIVPDRALPVVVHAPSHRASKGTAEILASLDRLAARGINFDLRLIEKQPNAVVRETLRDADVAIDQLFVSYGKFAAEALASGCATACVTYPDIEPFAHVRPLWHIAPGNIDGPLERLLTDRALRRGLAERGRPHVETFHDRTAVCERLCRALHGAINGQLQYDYYPTFCAERYVLPPNVELPRYQRMLAADVISEHGAPDGVDLDALARRGLIDRVALASGAAPRAWHASQGLRAESDLTTFATRWDLAAPRRPSSPEASHVKHQQADPCVSQHFSLAGLTDTSAPDSLVQALAEPLRRGMHGEALQVALHHAGQTPAACRAAALLLLGTGQFADAESMLDALITTPESDPVLAYYHAVARAVQGKVERTGDAMASAIARLPKTRRILFWGSTPLLHNRYWAEAMREGGHDSRTLMIEYYAAINRREDFDHYLSDFVPEWTDLRHTTLLAPYHALLFLACNGSVLHTSFDGGPLQGSACAPIEPALLKAAGIKSVVTTYGGDGALYSRIRDLSVRHALQLSYPDAARHEHVVEAKVARWTRDADCIIGNTHSLDGHGRWDILVPNCAQIDLARCTPKTEYNDHDGRNGVVRVMHSPNHRGVKGTEFIRSAVETLRGEGLQVELELTERMQNRDVLALMRGADVLAEQLILPFHGLNGIEGMAMGLPVISNLTMDDYLQVLRRFSYLDECPIVAASPETIVAVLRHLVVDPALRATLGRAGRAYAEKYHSYTMTRHLFGAIHQQVLHGQTTDLMNLFHPLRSVYVRSNRIDHPLQKNRLPTLTGVGVAA